MKTNKHKQLEKYGYEHHKASHWAWPIMFAISALINYYILAVLFPM